MRKHHYRSVEYGVKEKLTYVNVFGIINMIQAVLPEMRKVKYGKNINIGSISGKFTQSLNGR
ncbi:SDR family NAD(P)-dependent oxidoreductase [Cellulosilyticum ruminicola]|uniref:SDR family NAD(P)-dependent oxidoreductase n=1 Tax=Cellulosilyticum ruminicola TaxID=425254 RepID=UPI001FA817E3|nr:SDR family NAD(P)-dependent oxidoreductase [Cellulosilyticum ruminicola]